MDERVIENYFNNGHYKPLPSLDIAMYPDDVRLVDDTSDASQFNDRFIEPRVNSIWSLFHYATAAIHNLLLIGLCALVIHSILNDPAGLTSSIIMSLAIYVVIFFFSSIFMSMGPPAIRFNRRAQLIHVNNEGQPTEHFRWKDAVPFLRSYEAGKEKYSLCFLFKNHKNPDNPYILDEFMGFDANDLLTASACIRRLEFIRRYMEHGIKAIQPSQSFSDLNRIKKPTGNARPIQRGDGWYRYFIVKPFLSLVYLVALGPLVDRYIDRKMKQFTWHPEVELLCSEQEDLSDLDTSPLISNKEQFYIMSETGDYCLVDKDRQPIISNKVNDINNDFIKKHNSEILQLPPINIAMHPDKVCFCNDISDKTQFNERFIESRIDEGLNANLLFTVLVVHHVAFLILLIGLNTLLHNLDFYPLIIFSSLTIAGYIYAFYFLISEFKKVKPKPIRFNRQAQLVHYPLDDDQVLTLAWRDAKPYRLSFGQCVFLFPNPDPDNPNLIEVPMSFDILDNSQIFNASSRLEFIRSYMENGLESIMPCPKMINAGYHYKPSGHDHRLRFRSHMKYYYVQRFFHILFTGSIGVYWAKRQLSAYRWPDDVEKLCSEDADLTKVDTRPVTTRTDCFYGTDDISRFIYLDKRGNPV